MEAKLKHLEFIQAAIGRMASNSFLFKGWTITIAAGLSAFGAADTKKALLTLEPATPGHTLVIPRTHVVDLWNAEPRLASDLMDGVIRVGRAIDVALKPDGMNLITSAGSAADQTVFHLHLHVVPRWRRDEFGAIWPTGVKYEDAALGDAADRIREACRKV